MKYVSESAAAQKVSAYIILNKKGENVATVRAYHGATVTVNVFDHVEGFQVGRAGGWGYDKFTAALSGLIVDGHELNDHCGQNDKTKRLLKKYLAADTIEDQKSWLRKAERIGAAFANWSNEKGRYTSLHLVDGLNKLKLFGYRVIQAI